MDIGKSFKYVIEDAKWIEKLLIAAVVAMVPILNFAFLGYITEVLRNVAYHQDKPLPEWSDDFGGKFIKGFYLFVAYLVYAIPVWIVGCLWVVAFSVGISAASRSGDYGDALAAATSGVGVLFLCVIVLFAFALSFITPAINMHLAEAGTLASCFEFKEIIGLVRNNISNYLIAWVVYLAGGIVVGLIAGIASGVLGIIPCIGWMLSWIVSSAVSVYVMLVYGHLFGQVLGQNPG